MMVFELIAQLQKLPPTLPVLIDQTGEEMEMFKFAAVDCAAEVGIPDMLGGSSQAVVISHQDLSDDDDDD